MRDNPLDALMMSLCKRLDDAMALHGFALHPWEIYLARVAALMLYYWSVMVILSGV